MGESSSIKGLRKNMFNILDGQHNIHDNATLVDESNAKDGVVAAVKGPNRPIIDTGYYEMNELVGLHRLRIVWFTNITTGNGAVIQYWKKDINGNESHVDIPIPYKDIFTQHSGNSGGIVYFAPNYQYKIKVISDASISDTDYIAIDYLKILPVDNFAVISSESASVDDFIPQTPYEASIYVTVLGTGAITGVTHYSFASSSLTANVFVNPAGVYIQATAQANNTSDGGYVAHIANQTNEGFDVVVSCTAGTWTGSCGVNLTLKGYREAISI